MVAIFRAVRKTHHEATEPTATGRRHAVKLIDLLLIVLIICALAFLLWQVHALMQLLR
jgi:hypothetical protein